MQTCFFKGKVNLTIALLVIALLSVPWLFDLVSRLTACHLSKISKKTVILFCQYFTIFSYQTARKKNHFHLFASLFQHKHFWFRLSKHLSETKHHFHSNKNLCQSKTFCFASSFQGHLNITKEILSQPALFFS